ncbi:MAG TPA: precorrin-6A synthase (deacetylating) [Devosia sp.]|nr:precorrin-6A synthase (deacetylating) [Devosia sp.]
MRKILIIGIGAGNPDYLTVQAIEAMRAADVFFMPDKGTEKGGLNRIRLEFLARFRPEAGYRLVDFPIPERRKAETPDYRDSIDEWRGKLEAAYTAIFNDALVADEVGAFLVWGDPALYDGTLKILGDMKARGADFEFEVIAGISAVQALAAQHRVALNGVGEPVVVTTGRRVLAGEADALPRFVVMLDNEMTFRRFAGQPIRIYWGAYLGTKDEILIAGRLDDVLDEIVAVRSAAQQRHGWIMDTYLMLRED